MDDEYESCKMTGAKDQIANATVLLTSQALKAAIARMDSAPEKAVLLAGAAIPSMSGLAILFALPERQDDMCKQQHPDDLLFGALYFAASVEEHPNGIICGYSMTILQNAISMFKAITGREYTNIHPDLVEIFEKKQKEVLEVTPDHLKKFIPN